MHYLKKSKIIFLCSVILVFVLIIIFKLLFRYRNSNINSNDFYGTIEYYKIDGDKLTLQVKGKERIIATYRIKTYKEKKYLYNNIVLGSKIYLRGKLEVPSNNTIPNNFNYKKYLKYKNINLIMNTTNYKLNKKCNIFYKIRNFFSKFIIKKRRNEYYYMFIFGDKQYLDSDVYDLYKTNGITHLFAISGMHISIIILILKKFRINDYIIIIILFFYSFLVMLTPSVLRVTIFYTLKKIKFINSFSNIVILLFTALILSCINPYIIFDTVFQYSFIITAGLLLLKPKNIFLLSIYAFILSLPITLYNNYEVNFLSIIINIIIVPFISIIFFPLLLFSLILPINNIVVILINIFESLNKLLTVFKINIIIGKPTIILIILYYITLYFYSICKKKRYFFVIVFLVLVSKCRFYFNNNFVSYLNVEQGDSILIDINNKSIVIDTGGKISFNKKEKWKVKKKEFSISISLINYLKSLGKSKIDYLILTHGDYDHMGEAINLANNFKVEKVIFNCGEINDLENELIKVLDKKKIKYYSCIKELNIDRNKLYFLQTKEYDNENDNSNVIYTELNGYKFMFMGDASTTTENEIMNKYNLPDIDVLKVGHHGSKTSSSKEFIDEIDPKYSVISVGKNNRYGHPNKEALENLKESKIYRTDVDGSIMFKIKNNKLKIETCSP
ncbi:MAG: DNA internalization-related competence protein ComEC/Rec2 [Firmicutes bacterium]|nr:DNA internalization-related competence protein ComEC/Rec2 [Bacillota bacterium]